MQTGTKDWWKLRDSIDKIKPWLILGKGPTLKYFFPSMKDTYNIFSLNHVAKLVDSDICLIHDLDVLDIMVSYRSQYVFVPYHPHINFRPTKEPYAPAFGNVYLFNLSTWKGVPESSSPIVRAKYFSAESAFHILALLGIKEIYSLGVDGGTQYANCFSDMTPLTNGQKSFDKQFAEIAKICKKFKVNYKKLR